MAALSAVKQSKPMDIRFGTVETESPLSVKLSDKLILKQNSLILMQCVTDFTDADGRQYNWHLRTGEQVVLLRKPGGKQYLILGRIGS